MGSQILPLPHTFFLNLSVDGMESSRLRSYYIRLFIRIKKKYVYIGLYMIFTYHTGPYQKIICNKQLKTRKKSDFIGESNFRLCSHKTSYATNWKDSSGKTTRPQFIKQIRLKNFFILNSVIKILTKITKNHNHPFLTPRRMIQ